MYIHTYKKIQQWDLAPQVLATLTEILQQEERSAGFIDSNLRLLHS